MHLSEIIVAVIAGMITLIISLLGIYSAKRYNIGPNQEKLVVTLKDLVAAQQIRIDQLEGLVEEHGKQVTMLQVEVQRLTKLTISQALKISDLEGKQKGG
jgi:hypothetical protein